MSESSTGPTGPGPSTGGPDGSANGPSKAQAAFDRYKARLAYPAAPPWAAAPGWSLPQPATAAPAPAPAPAPTGVAGQLGETLRLGIQLLNAALASGAAALTAMPAGMGYEAGHGYGHGCECGCGCDSCCAPSCCAPSCCGSCCDPCCTPAVRSCC